VAHQVITRIEIHLTSGFGLPKLLPNFKQLHKLHVYLFKKLTRMNTKLTLTLQQDVIEEAKKYASSKGSSLSEIVENYFKLITEKSQHKNKRKLSPRISKLKGVLKVDNDFDYKEVLLMERLKKHNG